jgi:hypothetical protein
MLYFFINIINSILESCGYDTNKIYLNDEHYLDNKYKKYNKQLKTIDENKEDYTYHPIEF